MKKIFKVIPAFILLLTVQNVFSQDSFEFTNNSPVLQYMVPVQELTQGDDFEIKIADNTFTDIDQGDKIVEYKAVLSDGTELPAWINFDSEQLKFTGTGLSIPAGEYFIALEAYDSYHAKSVTEIYLRVE